MHVKERWHRSEKSGTMNGYVMKEEIIFWRMELLFVRSDVKVAVQRLVNLLEI